MRQSGCKFITPFFLTCRLTLKKPVHAGKHGIKSKCLSNGIICPSPSESVGFAGCVHGELGFPDPPPLPLPPLQIPHRILMRNDPSSLFPNARSRDFPASVPIACAFVAPAHSHVVEGTNDLVQARTFRNCLELTV